MSTICPGCSAIGAPGTRFCANCGRSFTGALPPPPVAPAFAYAAPPVDNKQGLATAGLVCGILSFLFFPVVLGPLGIIFGAIAWKAGNSRGMAALVVSVIGLPVGMLLGIMAFS